MNLRLRDCWYFLLGCCLLFFATSCNKNRAVPEVACTDALIAQEDSLAQCQYLYDLWRRCEQDDAPRWVRWQFIQTFPSTFTELRQMFDFPSCLSMSNDFALETGPIYMFRKIGREMPKEVYFSKLIDIGIGGYWIPDAMNEFQRFVLRPAFYDDPEAFFALLDARGEAETTSFLYYVFDSMHAHYGKVPKAFAPLAETSPAHYARVAAMVAHVDSVWMDFEH